MDENKGSEEPSIRRSKRLVDSIFCICSATLNLCNVGNVTSSDYLILNTKAIFQLRVQLF